MLAVRPQLTRAMSHREFQPRRPWQEHFAVNRFDGLDRQMLERLAQDNA